ncbi:hypothetical protein NY78_0583 [Desulfovibrio sp. TomC]|nr:hypothetical protein NY78_0583 [Desulfovibrio sp. TomC]
MSVVVLLWAAGLFAATAEQPLLFLSAPDLLQARSAVAAGDARLAPALERLRDECREAMAVGPWSVADKKTLPPSGDVHDYQSQPPYWWPNPATADGQPSVQRDGEVNPQSREGDVAALEHLIETVDTLSLGYFYTGGTALAERAALLLRTFFLDPATAMHPHLRFAQVVPGKAQGSGFGLIDTRMLPVVCDAATLLLGSPAWSERDMQGLRAWFAAYLAWLQNSPEGRQARDAKNNHGTWYDVQTAAYALFCGQIDAARTALARFPDRLAVQITADGSQPLELARTRSLSYSLSNLEGLFRLMLLGDRLGLDLWRAGRPEQGTPRQALDFLEPYLGDRTPWPYRQIAPVGHARGMALVLRLAARHYANPAYEATLAAVFGEKASKRRVWLLYPPAAAN